MKNTLIFNGSPRKNGNTAFLIDELTKRLKGSSKIINAYSCNISPCMDCRFCRTHGSCAVNDGMQTVYQDIVSAENIVIASPIYFSELTGPLLSVASRLQLFYSLKRFQGSDILSSKRRNGFVILAGGGDGASERAVATSKCLLSQMGAAFFDCAISHNTDQLSAENDLSVLEKIKTIAEIINK